MIDKHSSMPLPIGHELKGYRIEEVILVTGGCITYRALDITLDVPVTIKEYFPAGLVYREQDFSLSIIEANDADEYAIKLKLFLEQIIHIANLKHPNIVRMIRYFAVNRTGYMVTEFEEGQSLAEYLAEVNGPLDEETWLAIFVPVLFALERAHQEDIIHGGIEPSRILVRTSGEPLLLDICQLSIDLSESSSIYTEQHSLAENLEKSRSITTDIYSLGAILYQCVTGKLPISAALRIQAVEQGEDDPLQPAVSMTELLLTQRISTLIDSMMSLNKETRPQTIGVVLDTLRIPVPQKKILPATFYRKLIEGSNSTTADKSDAFEQDYDQGSTWSKTHKLILSGVAGSGKTTAIKTLSDISLMVREEKVTKNQSADQFTDDTSEMLRMDYGVMKIADSESLHLYGVPADVQAEYLRDVLQQGTIGIILLIDNSRKDPMRDLDLLLSKFSNQINIKIVVGITHVDVSRIPAISDYYTFLANNNSHFVSTIPIFSVDTRDYHHMSLLVQALLYSIVQDLEKQTLEKEELAKA